MRAANRNRRMVISPLKWALSNPVSPTWLTINISRSSWISSPSLWTSRRRSCRIRLSSRFSSLEMWATILRDKRWIMCWVLRKTCTKRLIGRGISREYMSCTRIQVAATALLALVVPAQCEWLIIIAQGRQPQHPVAHYCQVAQQRLELLRLDHWQVWMARGSIWAPRVGFVGFKDSSKFSEAWIVLLVNVTKQSSIQTTTPRIRLWLHSVPCGQNLDNNEGRLRELSCTRVVGHAPESANRRHKATNQKQVLTKKSKQPETMRKIPALTAKTAMTKTCRCRKTRYCQAWILRELNLVIADNWSRVNRTVWDAEIYNRSTKQTENSTQVKPLELITPLPRTTRSGASSLSPRLLHLVFISTTWEPPLTRKRQTWQPNRTLRSPSQETCVALTLKI